jgi:hypothetical protein
MYAFGRSNPGHARCTLSSRARLAADEQVGGPIQNVSVWRRDVDVSEHHYVTAFGYAVGAGGRPPEQLASLMASMELCDYT